MMVPETTTHTHTQRKESLSVAAILTHSLLTPLFIPSSYFHLLHSSLRWTTRSTLFLPVAHFNKTLHQCLAKLTLDQCVGGITTQTEQGLGILCRVVLGCVWICAYISQTRISGIERERERWHMKVDIIGNLFSSRLLACCINPVFSKWWAMAEN